jgi:hypothetical protein
VALARAARLSRDDNLHAKVVHLSRGRFPLVALRLRVVRPAQSGAGAEVGAGDLLVVVPALAMREQHADLRDRATELNAGAYYLRPGDRVAVRLDRRLGATWVAGTIERK